MADHGPPAAGAGAGADMAGIDEPTAVLPQLRPPEAAPAARTVPADVHAPAFPAVPDPISEPPVPRWHRVHGRWLAVVAGLVVLAIAVPAVAVRVSGDSSPQAVSTSPSGSPATPVAAVGAGSQPESRGDSREQGVRPPEPSPAAAPPAGSGGGAAGAPPPPAPPPPADDPPAPAGPWSTIVDNSSGRFTAGGSWRTSTDSGQRYGADFRYASPVEASDPAWYRADVPRTGRYRVEVWFPSKPGYNARSPYIVATTGGNQTVHISQQSGGGRWVSLGVFEIAAGDANVVAVSRWRTAGTGYIIADAVRITEA